MKNRLSQAEQFVMSIIWNNKGEDLQLYLLSEKASQRFGREWKPQTTATFITRLIKKGYITTYKQGRFTYYQPVVTLEEYRGTMLREFQEICFLDINEMREYLIEYCKNVGESE